MNDKEMPLPAHSALVTIRKFFKCDMVCICVLKKLCIVPTSPHFLQHDSCFNRFKLE